MEDLRRNSNAISTVDLTKVYPPDVRAVDRVTFDVEEGEIFGLLGPNGAGKTTTIKMLTTLARPTSGSIRVFGVDSLSESQEVRQMLGYVPQAVSADGDLSGYENLLILAKLFHVDRAERPGRIRTALEYMGLSERANDLVKHYSGGMMRRLEIAQVLVNRPRVLFLDEPSIGLDPASKRQVWDYIKRLNQEFGTTIMITTHDMAEADFLCHRLAIMNTGQLKATGTPGELKKSVGGDILTLAVSGGSDHISLPPELGTILSSEGGTIRILTIDGERKIPRTTDYLEREGYVVDSITLNRPTLDDVFMKFAGAGHTESGSLTEARSVRRSFARHGKS